MERKNGDFACFKKQSQKGTVYFNGTLLLDGKEYWISIFNNKSQKGEQYLSGSVQPKQPKPEGEKPKEETTGWDEEKNEFNDEIPFKDSRNQ